MKTRHVNQNLVSTRRHLAALLAIVGSAAAAASPVGSTDYASAPGVRIATIASEPGPSQDLVERPGDPMPASTAYDHGGDEGIHVTTFEFGDVTPVSAAYGGRNVSIPFSRPACTNGFSEHVCANGESPNAMFRYFRLVGDSGQFTYTVAETKDPTNTRSTTIYIR